MVNTIDMVISFAAVVSLVSGVLYFTNTKYYDMINNSYSSILFFDSENIEEKNLCGSVLILHLLFIIPIINIVPIFALGICIFLVILIYLNSKSIESETLSSYIILLLLGVGILITILAMGIYKTLSTFKENI